MPVLAVLPVSMVAFRAADPEDRGKACAGRAGAMVAAGPAGAGMATGEPMTFCHPVVTVPAVARRDGTVLAGGWLPDFVRLGELERHVGDGVIEGLAEAAVASGRVPAPQRRRIMSLPLIMGLTVAMTLMPDAGYTEAAHQLTGHLADVPWAQFTRSPNPVAEGGRSPAARPRRSRAASCRPGDRVFRSTMSASAPREVTASRKSRRLPGT
jgi:hypothetical protein